MIERGEIPGPGPGINMLGLLNRHNVKSRIMSLEEWMQEPERLFSPRGDGLEAYKRMVEEELGPQYSGNPAIVTGTVLNGHYLEHGATAEDRMVGEKMVYDGVDIKWVDGIPRIVLKFHQRDYADPESLPRIYYAHSLEGLQGFEVFPIMKTIKDAAEACRKEVQTDCFLEQPSGVQDRVLARHGALLEGQLLPEQYRVHFSAHLKVHDREPGYSEIQWSDTRNLGGVDPHISAEGRLKVGFGELIRGSDTSFKSKSDFDIADGAPCILLRHEIEPVTYAIPPDAIKSIRIV